MSENKPYRTLPDRYRHKARGTIYEILMFATLQIDGPQDMAQVVVYRDIETQRVWTRPYSDFVDGRFEKIEEPCDEQND